MTEIKPIEQLFSLSIAKVPSWEYWFYYKDHKYCIKTVFHTVQDDHKEWTSYNRITLMEYGPDEDLWESYTFTFDEYIDYSEQRDFTPHNCLTFNDRIFTNICQNFIEKDFKIHPENYYCTESHV